MYYYNRGLVRSRLNDLDQAIDSYEMAFKKLDEGATDYKFQCKFNLGICYRKKGLIQKSIDNLKTAVVLKGDKAAAHNNLALTLFENKQYEDALISYSKAISFEPSGVHYNNRGLTNYFYEKYDEAKDDFDKAIELDPSDPTIYFNRGNVYLNWNENLDYLAAHSDYDKALKIAPNNPKLWHAKGLAYQGQAESLFQQNHFYD